MIQHAKVTISIFIPLDRHNLTWGLLSYDGSFDMPLDIIFQPEIFKDRNQLLTQLFFSNIMTPLLNSLPLFPHVIVVTISLELPFLLFVNGLC